MRLVVSGKRYGFQLLTLGCSESRGCSPEIQQRFRHVWQPVWPLNSSVFTKASMFGIVEMVPEFQFRSATM